MSYGWGHVIRSLSLAQRLEKEGVEVLLGIEGDEGVNRFLATVTQPHFKASFADVDAQPEVRAFSPELVVLDMLEAPDELLARLKRPGSRLVAFNDLALPYAHADVTVSPQILPAYAPARAGQAHLNDSATRAQRARRWPNPFSSCSGACSTATISRRSCAPPAACATSA
jgi:spore coat polysaccharide biosynthesis predicted glycosyltransferase SpsG